MGQLAAQLNEISIHALLAESDRRFQLEDRR